jgi:outer membrane receptor protein involved in Fe transport
MLKKKKALKFLVILLLSCSFMTVPAQKPGISGRIVDSETGNGIPFVSIALFSDDYEKMVEGAISDDEGYFFIRNSGDGQFNLVMSFIGYNPDTLSNITVNQISSAINLGETALAPAVFELQGVNVQGIAGTTSRQIDRQTYRASDFETTRGGTAADVLNRLPSVTVDPDGNVSLRGTTDFMVYLNGKPTFMEPAVLLGQIAAGTIESIDIITVPTARFDAQGAGGIINITTKKSGVEGLAVVADGMLGGAPWADKTHLYSGQNLNYDRWGGGLNLIYQKNNLTLFGNMNYITRNLKSYRTGDARLLQPDGSYYHMVASGERLEWQKNHSASIGIDYSFNEENLISAYYHYGKRNQGRTAHYVYHNFFADINKLPAPGINSQEQWLYNPNTDDRTGVFHTVNFDYNKRFGNNRTLMLSALYEHSGLTWLIDNPDYSFNRQNNRQNELIRHFHQTDNTPLDGFRLTIDYEFELNNGHSLGIGLQPQYLNQTGGFNFDTLHVQSGIWGAHSEFNNNIHLTRAIYAGYIDYSGNLGSLAFRAGLRFEYTDQSLELENPDYLNIFQRPTQPVYTVKQPDWFPTVHLSYEMNESNSLILAGSRRINRPPTKNMVPFLYRRHHEVYVVGDPDLKPEYLTNAELSYRKRMGNQQFTLTGFYRGTDNAIFRVNTVYEEENVLIRSYTNSGNVKAFGGELNANLSAGSFARVFIGGSLYDFNVQGDIFGFRENNRSTNWNVSANTNLFLSSALRFTLDFDLRSATITSQGSEDLFYMSNAAINYTPAKLEGWDFGLKVIDILASNIESQHTRAYNSAGTQIFYQDSRFDRSGPILEFTVSWSFNMHDRSGRKTDSTFGREQF